jgi:hypothetical protein
MGGRNEEEKPMTSETTTETVALRDQAGNWYVLTPEILVNARASAEQQAALDEQANDDTGGFAASWPPPWDLMRFPTPLPPTPPMPPLPEA